MYILTMYTPNCEFVHTFVRLYTPHFILFSYFCARKPKTTPITSYNMSIIEFYNDTPVLAGIFTLAYTVVVGLFGYMLVELYKNH